MCSVNIETRQEKKEEEEEDPSVSFSSRNISQRARLDI